MTTIAEVRDALRDAIEVTGWRAYAYLPDAFAAPCVVVTRQEMDPRYVFTQATAEYQFTARALAGRTAEVQAQKQLDELTELSGSGSLLAQVQNEDNWPDGLIDYASVTRISGPLEVAISNDTYLAVDFDILIVF